MSQDAINYREILTWEHDSLEAEMIDIEELSELLFGSWLRWVGVEDDGADKQHVTLNLVDTYLSQLAGQRGKTAGRIDFHGAQIHPDSIPLSSLPRYATGEQIEKVEYEDGAFIFWFVDNNEQSLVFLPERMSVYAYVDAE